MKNLLEELRELNNEDEIEVPVDFRDRVMQSILQEDNHVSRLKYIIPACSVAVIMLVTVIVGNNHKKSYDMNLYKDKTEAENYILAEANIADDVANEEYMMDSINSSAKQLVKSEVASGVARDSLVDAEYYDEILNMLKINNIEAEKKDGAIRAKGKKEDIEVALYYFEDNIVITQDGEYVVIKEK